ncbi:MAG TPA: hypothetical protein VJM33_10060 [Microthrixaceae bacterium]|nr:hypothetical protein [Microthrixaceae bacterium]
MKLKIRYWMLLLLPVVLIAVQACATSERGVVNAVLVGGTILAFLAILAGIPGALPAL